MALEDRRRQEVYFSLKSGKEPVVFDGVYAGGSWLHCYNLVEGRYELQVIYPVTEIRGVQVVPGGTT